MKFHPFKSKVLSITNQQNMLHNLPFTIFQYRLDSTYIDYVSSYVYLGVTVNNKLLWKEQCNKLICKGNSKLGMLMRTCHFTMNKKQKITFYLTIVRSILNIVPLYGDLKVPTRLLLLMQYRKKLLSG